MSHHCCSVARLGRVRQFEMSELADQETESEGEEEELDKVVRLVVGEPDIGLVLQSKAAAK